MKAKLALEKYASTLGVRIKHYHADNGRFADNEFQKSEPDWSKRSPPKQERKKDP